MADYSARGGIPEPLSALLSEQRRSRIIYLDETDSTNERLRLLALEGAPSGQTVIANSQTAGRGRLGRGFSSPPDEGIYLSMLLRPDTPPELTAEITAWAAVAVRRAVARVCGVSADIKWVNDLMINGMKVCGILAESVVADGSRQLVVIGAGINVNGDACSFTGELKSTASSIYLQTGRKTDVAELTAAVIGELDALREAWPDGKSGYLAEYRSACVTTGREVMLYSGGGCELAFAESVDDSFALVVRLPDGSRKRVFSGEASVRTARS